MIRVYNYMAVGVALTGVVAWLAFQAAGGDAIQARRAESCGLTPFGQLVFSFPGQIVLFLGTLGLVFLISWRIDRLHAFDGIRAVHGLCRPAGRDAVARSSWSIPASSISRMFFISAASFGALSLYGYTTQRDLSPIGSFLMMGVIGIDASR